MESRPARFVTTPTLVNSAWPSLRGVTRKSSADGDQYGKPCVVEASWYVTTPTQVNSAWPSLRGVTSTSSADGDQYGKPTVVRASGCDGGDVGASWQRVLLDQLPDVVVV